MDFKEGKKYFLDGIEILKLDTKTAVKVSKDKKARNYAFLFFALVGLAQAIGTLNLPGIILGPIMYFLLSFVGVGIIHVLAKLFGGKAKFMDFYQVAGIGSVAMWISVIPILGPFLAGLVNLWYLVVTVVVLKAVHKLSTTKAIIVVAIPVVISAILVAIAVAMFAVMFAGLAGLAGNLPY